MFSWTRRPDHTLGLLLYLLLVGAAATSLLTAGQKVATGASVFVGQTVLLSAAALAIALVLLGIVTRKRIRWAMALSGMVMLIYAGLDAFFFGLFQKHPTNTDVRAAFDALRTGTIPLSAVEIGLLLGLSLGILVVSWLLLAGFAWLPRLGWLERNQTALLRFSLGLSCTILFFHDLLFPANAFPGTLFSLHRPEESTPGLLDKSLTEELHFDGTLLERQFAGLEDFSKAFPERFEARETPDILFIHAESLRASDFIPEYFPKTIPLLNDCLRPARHYSTGNTTGNGLFGVLHGLSASYAHVARARSFPPLPLRALRTLGYVNHLWYPNQALDFDELRPRVIGNDIEVHRVELLPVFAADERNVAAYLARTPLTTPRFDYLVIDSSHYDYSYPPEFEVHRPVGTLGGWFNPLTGEGVVARAGEHVERTDDDKAKIRNRYKNSLLYIDGLLARLLTEPRQTSSRPRLVALFGDHGEGFWDRGGVFGHSTALTDSQTLVPFVLCGPKPLRTPYQIGSHADIFPTIFDWMGVVSPAPFMTGKSLLHYDRELDYAIVRGMVNSVEASSHYAVFEPGFRTGFWFLKASRLAWVKNDLEESIENPPSYHIARAMTMFIGSTAFRAPAAKTVP